MKELSADCLQLYVVKESFFVHLPLEVWLEIVCVLFSKVYLNSFINFSFFPFRQLGFVLKDGII